MVQFFKKYTFLRKQLLERDQQLTTCLKDLYAQEGVISELRQFLEEHRYAVMIVNDHLEEKGLASYKLERRAMNPEVMEKQRENKLDHFELYSSMVHANVDGSGISNLEMDIQIYEEQIEALKEENEAWDAAAKVMLDDKVRLEKHNEKLSERLAGHDREMEKLRQELLAEIQDRERQIARQKEAFAAERKKLIKYGDVETDLHIMTIKKLQKRLKEQTKLVVSLKQVLRVPRLTR